MLEDIFLVKLKIYGSFGNTVMIELSSALTNFSSLGHAVSLND